MMYDPSDYIVSTTTPIVPCHWHGTASPCSSAFWEIHHDGSYDLIPMSLSKAPSSQFLQTEAVVVGSASVQEPARACKGSKRQNGTVLCGPSCFLGDTKTCGKLPWVTDCFTFTAFFFLFSNKSCKSAQSQGGKNCFNFILILIFFK